MYKALVGSSDSPLSFANWRGLSPERPRHQRINMCNKSHWKASNNNLRCRTPKTRRWPTSETSTSSILLRLRFQEPADLNNNPCPPPLETVKTINPSHWYPLRFLNNTECSIPLPVSLIVRRLEFYKSFYTQHHFLRTSKGGGCYLWGRVIVQMNGSSGHERRKQCRW